MARTDVLGLEIRQYVGGGRRALVPGVLGATAYAQQAKGERPRKSFEELLAEAEPAARELDERLRTWADEHGYSSVTPVAARGIVLSDGSTLAQHYPPYGVEVNVKRLRDHGRDELADGIQEFLDEAAVGRKLTRKFPTVRASEVLPRFDQYTIRVLEPYAHAMDPKA